MGHYYSEVRHNCQFCEKDITYNSSCLCGGAIRHQKEQEEKAKKYKLEQAKKLEEAKKFLLHQGWENFPGHDLYVDFPQMEKISIVAIVEFIKQKYIKDDE